MRGRWPGSNPVLTVDSGEPCHPQSEFLAHYLVEERLDRYLPVSTGSPHPFAAQPMASSSQCTSAGSEPADQTSTAPPIGLTAGEDAQSNPTGLTAKERKKRSNQKRRSAWKRRQAAEVSQAAVDGPFGGPAAAVAAGSPAEMEAPLDPSGTAAAAASAGRPAGDTGEQKLPKPKPQGSNQTPGLTYANAVRRQRAVIVSGECKLTEEQLGRVRRRVDKYLIEEQLDDCVNQAQFKEGSLYLWPSSAESGLRLLRELPGLDWDAGLGTLTFNLEEERPRHRRHRIFVPESSALANTNELRQALLRRNPSLPTAGLIAYQTLPKQGKGFTAIMGLTEVWMKQYPDLAHLKLGLCSLQIFCFDADSTRPDPPRKEGKRAAKIQAGGAPPPKAARKEAAKKADRPRDVDPASGKAARAAAAETRKERRPPRSTIQAGLVQASELATTQDRPRPKAVASVTVRPTPDVDAADSPYPFIPRRVDPGAPDWFGAPRPGQTVAMGTAAAVGDGEVNPLHHTEATPGVGRSPVADAVTPGSADATGYRTASGETSMEVEGVPAEAIGSDEEEALLASRV